MVQASHGIEETQIGPVPSDWQIVKLTQVVDFTRKQRSVNIRQFTEIPFIPMELISDSGVHIDGYVPKTPDEIRSGTYCEKGDILLAKITPSFENGKQAILTEVDFDFAYATTEVYAFHPKADHADALYLFHLFRHPSIRGDIAKKMEGTTGRQRIPKNVVQDYLIPLPPLDEQRRIAAVLTAIQDAIAAQEDVIAAARAFKRSLMHRLFTYGPGRVPAETKETLYGEVPETWDSLPLSKCAKVQTGTAKGRKFRPGDDVISVPYLRVANVQDGYLDLSEIKEIRIRRQDIKRYRLEIGDVLMTEGGDFDKLGRGFIWNGEIEGCIHQNHVFAVRTDRAILQPDYLAYLAQSSYGKNYFLSVAHRTTNLASINSTKLKALPVLVPSQPEQTEIARIMAISDTKIAAEEDRKAALDVLFKSMLHQLMTGQIRLLRDEGLPVEASWAIQ